MNKKKKKPIELKQYHPYEICFEEKWQPFFIIEMSEKHPTVKHPTVYSDYLILLTGLTDIHQIKRISVFSNEVRPMKMMESERLRLKKYGKFMLG